MEIESYRLYGYGAVLRIEAFVSLRAGRRMARRGHVEEGMDRDGITPCFRRLRPLAKQRKMRPTRKVEVRDEDAVVVFARKDVEALAGRSFKDGRSHTARMSEEQKVARVERIFAESVERSGVGIHVKMEDRVERATNKQNAWGKIGNLLNEVRVVESACL
ncbi:hypothetical protein GCM10011507_35070 [Edaphobacter acidisoli]|uniref:Uncharacterized protein n=1 Tax=Edaphobacter acidisoli TaxID=2040573 RepID=A0A916S2Y1_9BACT|nr:hypothetical protein [Edaphobacter acidisoli]GGA80836.1 hypothetical protein GCM10011507_35070 [Edaphobacter acidisoli]